MLKIRMGVATPKPYQLHVTVMAHDVICEERHTWPPWIAGVCGVIPGYQIFMLRPLTSSENRSDIGSLLPRGHWCF